MEGVALAAMLLTTDAEVRRSEPFAVWCEVCRFPDERRLLELADGHLSWLQQERLRLERAKEYHWIDETDYQELRRQLDETIAEQYDVMETYRLVRHIRLPPAGPLSSLAALRERIGDDDYFAGRLPPPVTCQRR